MLLYLVYFAISILGGFVFVIYFSVLPLLCFNLLLTKSWVPLMTCIGVIVIGRFLDEKISNFLLSFNPALPRMHGFLDKPSRKIKPTFSLFLYALAGNTISIVTIGFVVYFAGGVDWIIPIPDWLWASYCILVVLVGMILGLREALKLQSPIGYSQEKEIATRLDTQKRLLTDAEDYIAEEKYDDAIKKASKALELNPHSAKAYHLLGAANLGKNLKIQAAVAFRKVLDIEPDNRYAQAALENLRQTTEMTIQSAREDPIHGKHFTQYMANSYRQHYETQVEEGYRQLEQMLLPYYLEAAELFKDNVDLWCEAGRILAHNGQTRKALNCLDKACALEPDNERFRRIKQELSSVR